MCIAEIFFAWDLGVIFLGTPSFKILRFRKSFFLKIQILRCHRKMCRLFPYIPIFKGVFLVKSVKKMCMCAGVKNHIVTCEKCMFWCEKGYKWILAPGSPKTTYSNDGIFSNKAGESFNLAKIFLNVRVRL